MSSAPRAPERHELSELMAHPVPPGNPAPSDRRASADGDPRSSSDARAPATGLGADSALAAGWSRADATGPSASNPASIPAPIVRDPNPGVARFLLHRLYDVAYLVAIVVSSPWWVWRCARSGAFRRMAAERLLLCDAPPPRTPGKQRVLVHGVSVGEVKGAQALVRSLCARPNEFEVVISATTDTGMAVARKTYPDLPVVRFPIDMSFLVARFLQRIDPACVVLVELEIWPNFLRCSNRLGIPMAVVNGRITGSSHGRYRWFKRLLPQFNRLSLLCVQDEDYARRFRELWADPERILITGNIKVDGLKTGAVAPRAEMSRLLGARSGELVLVAGSTHEPEEALLLDALRAANRRARVRVILVPRHPERADGLVRDLEARGERVQRLSSLRAGEAPDPSRVALVDTIGELEQVYALADVVFVGGSLIPHGGQNMLEPAAQGRPVVFGPHVHNFVQEVALLERAGACVKVRDERDLATELARLFDDAPERARMAAAGIAAVQSQKGATALTLAALEARCLRRANA